MQRTIVAQEGSANVGEAILLPRIQPLLKLSSLQGQQRRGCGKPQVRLLVGRPPVPYIRDREESRQTTARDLEITLLIVVPGNRTGNVVRPGARFSGREAHAQRL